MIYKGDKGKVRVALNAIGLNGDVAIIFNDVHTKQSNFANPGCPRRMKVYFGGALATCQAKEIKQFNELIKAMFGKRLISQGFYMNKSGRQAQQPSYVIKLNK